MHRMPSQRVVFHILRICLHCSRNDGGQTDEHGGREDEDQQRQQQDESQRCEHKAQRDGLPTELLEFETDWRCAMHAAFDKDMLLAQPDEQWAQRLTERPQEGGLHPAELPDAMEITSNETRFGVVGTGGLLKRGRLSSLRCRDRIHRLDGCTLKRTPRLPSDRNSQISSSLSMHRAGPAPGA